MLPRVMVKEIAGELNIGAGYFGLQINGRQPILKPVRRDPAQNVKGPAIRGVVVRVTVKVLLARPLRLVAVLFMRTDSLPALAPEALI